MPEPSPCRCADCGFLSIRRTDSRKFEEVDADIRVTGRLPVVLPANQRSDMMELGRTQWPFCLMMAETFGHPTDTEFLYKIQVERLCGSYAKWQPGFSPKEHREMITSTDFANRLEEQREKERRWEEEREEKSRRWEEQRDKAQSELHKQQLRATMASAVVNAVIAGVLGLLAVLIATFAK